MSDFSFERLQVYQKAREYVKDVYVLTYKFPQSEKYCLSDQLKRAAVSIPSNIAEGSGRSSYKDKTHFVEIAYGSLMETLCQLQIATDLGFVSQEEFTELNKKIHVIAKLLSGMRATFKNASNAGKTSNNQ